MINPGHALPLVAVGLFAAVGHHGEHGLLPLGCGDAYGLIDNEQLHDLWQNGQRSRIGGDAVPELICDHAAHGQAVLLRLDRCDAVGVLISARDVRPLINSGHALPLVAVGLFAAVGRHGEHGLLPLGSGDVYGLIDNAQLHDLRQNGRRSRIGGDAVPELNGQRSRIGGDAVPELICNHAAYGQAVLFRLDRCDAVGILISTRDVLPLIHSGHALPLVAVGLFAAGGRHGEHGLVPLGRGDAYGLIDDAHLHGKQQTHMVI